MLLILITGPQRSGKSWTELEIFRSKSIVKIIDQRPTDDAHATIVVSQENPAWIEEYYEYLHFTRT